MNPYNRSGDSPALSPFPTNGAVALAERLSGPGSSENPARIDSVGRGFVEGLSRALGMGVILTSADGRIVDRSAVIEEIFPDTFAPGTRFARELDRVTVPATTGAPFLSGPAGSEAARRVLRGGELRCSAVGAGPARLFSHIRFPVSAPTASPADLIEAHCLLDIRPEKQLFDSYQGELKQLHSMREIIELLYESVGFGDVLNLILVAVTSGEGFGFNRAFFLEVVDGRLKGRLGIGPANAEEAHRIWSHLAEFNTTLRETLSLLTQASCPPDAATQDLARQIDLPLDPGSCKDGDGGILKACRDRRAAAVAHDSGLCELEKALFRTLGSESLAVVPLTVQDRLAGVLLADNFITGRAITAKDVGLLESFSRYAAIALQNSNLLEERTRSLQQLREANHQLQTHQQRLLQAEKLSTLGKVAACVSHEIRNPLAAIGGLTRAVLDDLSNPQISREMLEIVVREVERLERFLKETLSFVKPVRGPMQEGDLVEIVRGVAATFREQFQRSHVELDLEVGEAPMLCSTDPDLLRGALTNLLRNAEDALTSRGGRIRLRLERHDDHFRIDVADDGPGIPEEIRDRIFEPFVTNKEDGTGIGLAIAHENIRSLGGSVSLKADPEEYSTLFRIRIPCRDVPDRGTELSDRNIQAVDLDDREKA